MTASVWQSMTCVKLERHASHLLSSSNPIVFTCFQRWIYKCKHNLSLQLVLPQLQRVLARTLFVFVFLRTFWFHCDILLTGRMPEALLLLLSLLKRRFAFMWEICVCESVSWRRKVWVLFHQFISNLWFKSENTELKPWNLGHKHTGESFCEMASLMRT